MTINDKVPSNNTVGPSVNQTRTGCRYPSPMIRFFAANVNNHIVTSDSLFSMYVRHSQFSTMRHMFESPNRGNSADRINFLQVLNRLYEKFISYEIS